MRNVNLIIVGAICAVLTTLSFVVGVAFSAGSGVQTIIPDTGTDAIDWINDVDDAGGPFFVGAWFVILGGFLGLLALTGFWEALRDARAPTDPRADSRCRRDHARPDLPPDPHRDGVRARARLSRRDGRD